MIFLGVDPGMQGAISSLSADSKLITISDFPELNKRIDVLKFKVIIDSIRAFHGCEDIICCLEKSTSRTQQGVTSMFNYGVTYGILYSVLKMSGVKIVEITPQKWKKSFGLISDKKIGKVITKEDAVDVAIELFPSRADMFKRMSARAKRGYVIYDGRADSILISEYCRRTYK